jgi:hypothetical protein
LLFSRARARARDEVMSSVSVTFVSNTNCYRRPNHSNNNNYIANEVLYVSSGHEHALATVRIDC